MPQAWDPYGGPDRCAWHILMLYPCAKFYILWIVGVGAGPSEKRGRVRWPESGLDRVYVFLKKEEMHIKFAIARKNCIIR